MLVTYLAALAVYPIYSYQPFSEIRIIQTLSFVMLQYPGNARWAFFTKRNGAFRYPHYLENGRIYSIPDIDFAPKENFVTYLFPLTVYRSRQILLYSRPGDFVQEHWACRVYRFKGSIVFVPRIEKVEDINRDPEKLADVLRSSWGFKCPG